MSPDTPSHLLFAGPELRAAGDLRTVALACQRAVELACRTSEPGSEPVLVFETATGRQIDLDVSGSRADVAARYAAAEEPEVPLRRGRGRPRLGVVGREVTLLPRHWAWLDQQRGGASAALRRLVDQARRDNQHAELVARAQDRANRFLSAMAGNLPGFEEAMRALYQGDRRRYEDEIARWPVDVRRYAWELAAEAFP